MVDNFRFKFEVKPGRYCYIQTEEQQEVGRAIKCHLEEKWCPPVWCCHLKQGGHIASLNKHVGNEVFAAIDLANFFGHVGRSKVIRSLKRTGYSYAEAKEIAVQSTVRHRDRTFVPYGFVQSPLLATIALVESYFGAALVELDAWGITKSLYVDDVILSHPTNSVLLGEAHEMLIKAADKAGFEVNAEKSQTPSTWVVAFNIRLQKAGLTLTDEKMSEFRSRILGRAIGPSTIATIRYAELVNRDQGNFLREEVGLFPN